MVKKILSLILLTLICLPAIKAQDATEQALIQRRAAEMVSQLGDYLNYMADKEKSEKTRQYYRKKALNLFIGKGESYVIGGRSFPAVSMQTTSVNTQKVRTTPMAQYFTNLINLNYGQVKLTTTEVGKIKVSDLKKVDNDTYVCTCYIEQVFKGYSREGKPIYGDITRKSVQCYVTVENTVMGTEYIVQLGNITATETKRI